jgi:hypothetical protein
MSRIDPERALFLGVVALQDYVGQARRTPLESTIQLRALLALLALQGKGEADAYLRFWRDARQPLDPSDPNTTAQNYLRGTHAQIQWTRITRDLGFPAMSLDFHQRVQTMLEQMHQPKPPQPEPAKPPKPTRGCGWL